MIEGRHQAYLEAMNIPVWVERDQSAYLKTADLTEPNKQLAPEIIAGADAAPASSETKPAPAVTPSSIPAATTSSIPAATTSSIPAATPVSSPELSPGLKLGPGSGGVMLICGKDSDSSSKLANDIARSLGKMPVWSWPDSDEQAISPGAAVDENLFTCVAVFGEALGRLMFGTEIPAALGSAKLVILPSMSELASKPSARRELWSVLCRSGMIVS